MVAQYLPDTVIRDMPDGGAAANTYRNRVVSAYFVAIDARYSAFKRGLSRSGKGSHLGFDTLTLGLTGLGSMLAGAAQELSSGATAIGGLRSSFDRELFAEKTLPVLISLMDSKRLAVRADILRGLSQDEGAYTIEEAFSDLMRYEAAGSIDVAISEAAAAAADQAREVNYDYSKAIELCTVDTATATKRRKLMNEIQQLEIDAESDANKAVANRALLQTAATSFGVVVAAPATNKTEAMVQLTGIRDKLQTVCDSTVMDGLITQLQTAGVPVT